MNFIKKWLLGREIRKIQQNFKDKSPVESSLDEYIKEAVKRHSDAQRTADKMLKIKLLDQQTRQTLSKMQELDDDDEDYDDEEENSDDFGDKILKDLVNKFLASKAQNSSQPEAANNFTPSKLDEAKKLGSTLSPEHKKWVKDNYGIDL